MEEWKEPGRRFARGRGKKWGGKNQKIEKNNCEGVGVTHGLDAHAEGRAQGDVRWFIQFPEAYRGGGAPGKWGIGKKTVCGKV